jgi:hypothetical protein
MRALRSTEIHPGAAIDGPITAATATAGDGLTIDAGGISRNIAPRMKKPKRDGTAPGFQRNYATLAY